MYDPLIHLKGMIVFNGVTRFDYDVWPSFIKTAFGFGLLPLDLYTNYMSNDSDCLHTFHDAIPHNNSFEC